MSALVNRGSRPSKRSVKDLPDSHVRTSVRSRIFPKRIKDKVEPSEPRVIESKLVIRPQDLLVLKFDFVNLKLKVREEEPYLIPDGEGDALIIVGFPPQNIAEKAFFMSAGNNLPAEIPDPDIPGEVKNVETVEDPLDAPPIDTRISEESRIVFKVPSKETRIPYTISGLLDAISRFEMSVPACALPPRLLEAQVIFFDQDLMTVKKADLSRMEGIILATRARQRLRAQGPFRVQKHEALTKLERPIDQHLIIDSKEHTSEVGTGLRVGLVKADVLKEVAEAIVGSLLLQPRLEKPGPKETAIESPYRLIISPSKLGAWAHSPEPVRQGDADRTELWHTRLGTRTKNGIDETSHENRIIRAVWARGDFDPDPRETPIELPEFRMSLDDYDRHNIVHLSSNYHIREDPGYYQPRPIDVNLLMLSSLGTWMDVEGAWDPPAGVPLSVEKWIHRGTMGRDHYVKVVYRGFLFPFGHRASLIKITERKFHPNISGNPAYLRQRMFIVVQEKEKLYGDSKLYYDGDDDERFGEFYSHQLPLRKVQLETLITPDLDDPNLSAVFTGVGWPRAQDAFWAKVRNELFHFKIIATDITGNVTKFTAPLIWINKDINENQERLHDVAYFYENDVKHPYGNQSNLDGQFIAYAPTKKPDDTSFETTSLEFGAEVPYNVVTFNNLPKEWPHFHPVTREAQLMIPALRKLSDISQAGKFKYYSVYLKKGFSQTTNIGEIILEAVTTLPIDFSSKGKSTGALVTPNLQMSGLSRSLGPVAGSISTLAAGTFDPASFFPDNALMFGCIKLKEVIEGFGVGNLLKVPRFIGERLNKVERFLRDLERLRLELDDIAVNYDNLNTQITNLKDKIIDLTNEVGSPDDLIPIINALVNELENFVLPIEIPDGITKVINARISDILLFAHAVGEAVDLIDNFVSGFELATALDARFEWRPTLKQWGISASDPIFIPPPKGLLIAVEAKAKDNANSKQTFSITSSMEDFELRLIAPYTFIKLKFKKVQFTVEAGKKPDIDVEIENIVFDGALSFVETLKDLIPLTGFSDPPSIDVDASGIKASYTLALPNISIGVFSIENMSIGAGFEIPFVGDPLSFYFKFCERENPALLTVSCFGGGFFFGITLNPDGIYLLEAAIEFGANASVDFGVASGGVSVMAGLYFKMETYPEEVATLAGYFRMRGHVRALGIVTVSIELYLEMSYESGSGKCVGRASLKIEIDLWLFSVSITITCEKKFAGSGSDPTFAQLMSPYRVDPADPTSPEVQPWEEYCTAFA